jgi:hypothetical protein
MTKHAIRFQPWNVPRFGPCAFQGCFYLHTWYITMEVTGTIISSLFPNVVRADILFLLALDYAGGQC